MATSDRWTPPTLHAELVRRRRAKGDLEPVRNRQLRCEACRAPHVPLDMLVDLRPLPAATRAQLGFAATVEWICTGCLGTAHNCGRLSHHELFQQLGATPEALEWARAHTDEFPYPDGSWAHAEAHVLALGLEPPASLAAPDLT